MYLTFSECFEIIEPTVQKILVNPKLFFSENVHFPVKGVKTLLVRLICFYLLVQLPPNTLQMLMAVLFYDVKLKNPDSPFFAIFGPPDFDTLLLIT